MTDLLSSLQALQSENARLIALLDDHGIEWRLPPEPTLPEPAPPLSEPEPSRLSTAEKIALFRRLFRGRTDVPDPMGKQDHWQDWLHTGLWQ